MKIGRSLKTNSISQYFGRENTHPSVLGQYEKWGLKGHNGWDWSAKDGQPIYWDCLDCVGKVVRTSTEENEGLGVVVLTDDGDGVFQHRFWHLKDISCKVGQILDTGTLVGHADSTGHSTGTHLHRDLKELDKDYKKKYPQNGYKGAIDLMPFYQDIFVKSLIDNLKQQVNILTKVVSIFKKLLNL